MSDEARKDFSTSKTYQSRLYSRSLEHELIFPTEASETLTPDSQKSGLEKAKESVTDTADSVAASVQPGKHSEFDQLLSTDNGHR